MQPLTAPPRGLLTEAQVTAIIRDSSSLKVSGGCELVDLALNVVEDITDDLAGGTVSRNSYATLHGTASLQISRTLDWGAALIRPYMVLTAYLAAGESTSTIESVYSDIYSDSYGEVSSVAAGGEVSARFNLGVYAPSVPRITHDMHPHAADVQCFDILHLLHDPVGEAYAVDAGVGYLAAVEAVLTGRGFTQYVIDQASTAAMLPLARVWPLDEQTTWLTVVNDLLASIGYAGIWSDWDGRLRCAPYEPPFARAPEWYYEADGAASMVGMSRTVEQDWFSVPNRWIAVRSNVADDVAPVEGNGIYSFTNSTVGPTSVEARNGRVVTRFLPIDAADHTALVAAAQVSIDADMRLPSTIETTVSPNPLHWHFDRLVVSDPHIGPPADVVCTEWTLTLNGSADQSMRWTVLG